MGLYDFGTTRKRTLGIRDKQILYRNARGKCQNPACNRKIEFDEMQVGHKKAHARGGNATLKNSVCLCYRCNKLQGTDSWEKFLKKQGIETKEVKAKKQLKDLSLRQLKELADKHNVKIKGRTQYGLIGSYRVTPTKSTYITRLKKVVSEDEIQNIRKEKKIIKKKKRKRRDDFWGF